MFKNRGREEFNARRSNIIAGTLQSFSNHEHFGLVTGEVLNSSLVVDELFENSAANIIVLISEPLADKCERSLAIRSFHSLNDSFPDFT